MWSSVSEEVASLIDLYMSLLILSAYDADLWYFPAAASEAAGRCVLCYYAPGGPWDHQEVHEQACEDLGEEGWADFGGY